MSSSFSAFCIAVASDSEIAFRFLGNRVFYVCVFFVKMIVFFIVCLFDLIHPIFCLCGVICRFYLVSLLFLDFFFDVNVRIIDAKSRC